MKDLLPFVKDVGVDTFAGKYLLFNLKEKYARRPLPASLISEGTISIAAMIVALYFETQHIAVFEEPERNMHPSLIEKVVKMLKDASSEKQIIVTTHNPQLVRHAQIENLLLIRRNEAGFSTISRPAGFEEVKLFLKHEIGLDGLFAQALLEA